MTEPLRLISIAATGQAGSTVLSRLLGAREGVLSVGEVGFLWDRALLEDVPCSCQQPFSSCPFWREVGRVAFGGWSNLDADAMVATRDRLNFRGRGFPQWGALPMIAFPGLSKGYRATVERYAATTYRLLVAARDVAGARVIVDAMKQPPHVFMLRQLPDTDLRFIHLVRDSRGVAYSNLKWVPRQGADPDAFRPRHRPQQTSFRWDWINLAFERLGQSEGTSIRLRYEDLTQAPQEQLARVCAWLSSRSRDPSWQIDSNSVSSASEHLVAGNRVRLSPVDGPLRPDVAWRNSLRPRDRRLVTALTWPLLMRYGYPLTPQEVDRERADP